MLGMTGPEQWQLGQQERISKAIREGGAEGCVIEGRRGLRPRHRQSQEVSWAIPGRSAPAPTRAAS